MTFYYSTYTNELINTNTPADWMASTEVQPPAFEAGSQGCFWTGDAWEVRDFEPEPVPVPAAVTMRQARLALLAAGLLEQAEEAISGMAGAEGAAAKIEWEYATEVRRDSALVAGMAEALGIDGAGLDALFVSASSL